MKCHPRHLCLDCEVCTRCIREYPYALHDRLWYSTLGLDVGMLCVGCVERRLGRKLRAYDFVFAGSWVTETQSPRLQSRKAYRGTMRHD